MRRLCRMAMITIECALYAAFLYGDVTASYQTTWLKYTAILLIAFAAIVHISSRDSIIVAAAMCLTATADLYLLVLNRQYALGILLFAAVQILYAIRLARFSQNSPSGALAYRIPAGLLGLVLLRWLDGITALALSYISLFAINLIAAIRLIALDRSRKCILFAAGLALFFCCDLCVGLYHLQEGSFSAFAGNAIWAFYLPGQMLILFSAFDSEVLD